MTPAVEAKDLTFRYGARQALDDLDLQIERGEVFVFLGPNGGGKTTLFRLLSTLIPLQTGEVKILGLDLRTHKHPIRSRLGVVFQAPSLDRKLTVMENLRHQGALYGMYGRHLKARQQELLEQLGLRDRANELVERLSGGLRRRVEIAKAMLHSPQVFLLDEPSTGLDPGARSDLWRYLRQLQQDEQVTIVLTTHLLEEADRADRSAILHEGRWVAMDSPDVLRASVGGDSITLQVEQPEHMAALIRERYDVATTVLDGTVRLEQPDGHRWVNRLMDDLGEQITAIRVGKPTLEDVFVAKTGHRFWDGDDADE